MRYMEHVEFGNRFPFHKKSSKKKTRMTHRRVNESESQRKFLTSPF